MCEHCPKTLEAADSSLAQVCDDSIPAQQSLVQCSQPEVEPALELLCEHHFAPGEQTLRARFRSTGLAADEVVLTITDADGTLVYQQRFVNPGNAEHALGWQGRGNQGAYDDALITPLHSPYTLKVRATTAGLEDTKDTHVLYHSVVLRLGDYGDEPDRDGDDTAKKKWAQYTLNALGYFAGPVDGVIGPQSRRALMRYAYENPHFDERDGEGARFFDDATLRADLTAGACGRQILNPPGLPAHGHAARLYIDHNYYYYLLQEFLRADGNVRLDRDKLDRPHLPLEVTVALMSQDDADGTGAGVSTAASRPAVGEVDIEWFADELLEDAGGLPDATAACPTAMRSFMNLALVAVTDGGRNNCPVALGGHRHAPDQVNRNYFCIGAQLPPYTSRTIADRVLSKVHQGDQVAKRGTAGVLFQGSYIAGDSYILRARICFEGHARKQALETAHRLAHGNRQWNEILGAGTGTVTVWRRHRVSAVINWPGSKGALATDWGAVAAEYARAYCELDHGHVATITGQHFVDNYQDGIGFHFRDHAQGALAGLYDLEDFGAIQIGGAAIFTPPAGWLPAQGALETADSYQAKIESLLSDKIDDDLLQSIASSIANITLRNLRPGAIAIHGKWVPSVPVKPYFKPSTTFDPKVYCIGLTMGVVVYSFEMFPAYKHSFIVAHEMGHSRFLRHHETKSGPSNDIHGINQASDNPTDHDLRDHNCTMCYPFGIPTRPDLKWAPLDGDRSAFCGKCLLKLRGWDISQAQVPYASPAPM